jgi:hypothetical protein
MKKTCFNKKGQGIIASLFIFMIFAFIIVLVSVIFVYIGNTTEQHLKTLNPQTQSNWTEIVDMSIGKVNESYQTLNWLTAFIIVGYMLALLIGCVFANEHPVVFVLYLFISIIAIIVSVPISNAYFNLYNDSTLNPTFLGFPQSSYLLFHLPTIMTVLTLLGSTIITIRLIRGRENA